jgi:hypothetical protein
MFSGGQRLSENDSQERTVVKRRGERGYVKQEGSISKKQLSFPDMKSVGDWAPKNE